MLTNYQIKWASDHDWFLLAKHGSVFVRNDLEGHFDGYLVFNDIEKLRAWAGY